MSSMFSNASAFWRDRLKASGIHLILSLVVAALSALLVFGIWYPYPYREISGGRELFLLVVTVDVILGPLITLAIFDRSKGWPVLRRAKNAADWPRMRSKSSVRSSRTTRCPRSSIQ